MTYQVQRAVNYKQPFEIPRRASAGHDQRASGPELERDCLEGTKRPGAITSGFFGLLFVKVGLRT